MSTQLMLLAQVNWGGWCSGLVIGGIVGGLIGLVVHLLK